MKIITVWPVAVWYFAVLSTHEAESHANCFRLDEVRYFLESINRQCCVEKLNWPMTKNEQKCSEGLHFRSVQAMINFQATPFSNITASQIPTHKMVIYYIIQWAYQFTHNELHPGVDLDFEYEKWYTTSECFMYKDKLQKNKLKMYLKYYCLYIKI